MSKRRPAKSSPFAWEMWGQGILVVLIAAFVAASWRRWADPLVDFGRELYLPWQINQGAVIYRDFDANYGPLSQYFNAIVFRIFGPGIIHLAMVNLVIYAGILILLYQCLKTAWKPFAAFVGSLVFVVIFSFSQFVGIANYNFLTPYAHETTHGFALILLLITALARWLQRLSFSHAFWTGLICGTVLLLKIEIIFTATLVVCCGIVLAYQGRRLKPVSWGKSAVFFLFGGLIPTLAASIVLWMTGKFTPKEAFLWVNSAWTGLFIYAGITSDQIQTSFLGLDNPIKNLTSMLYAGGLSLLVAYCLALGIRKAQVTQTVLWISAGALILVGIVVSMKLPWLEVGRALPIWLAATAVMLWRSKKDANQSSVQMGWLLLVAAIAFLGRMALNPRIYHYGFCQAALAGVVTMVAIWKLLPDGFSLSAPKRWVYLSVVGSFILVGLWKLQSVSLGIYAMKTQVLGIGADAMYGFSQDVNPTTRILEDSRVFLSKQPDLHHLLVVPEGIMLNYLLRAPTPSHVYTFNPFWLKWRESVLCDLAKRPPDYVVIIGRDLREYGVQRFGENPEHGSGILSWINWNCTRIASNGIDPLDFHRVGVEIYRRNSP